MSEPCISNIEANKERVVLTVKRDTKTSKITIKVNDLINILTWEEKCDNLEYQEVYAALILNDLDIKL